MAAMDMVLGFISGRAEAADAPLQRVSVWAAQCESLLRRYASSPSPEEAKALCAAIEAGTPDLLMLGEIAPSDIPTELQRVSESVLEKLDAGATDFTAELAGFNSNARRLAGLRHRSRAKTAFLQFLKVAVYVVPLAVAYLVGVYFRLDEGLYRSSRVVVWPPGAYDVGADGAYTLNGAFEKWFFEGFSRVYFDRGYGVRNRVFARGGIPELEVKLAFRNPKRADPIMVSAVEVAATSDKAPFPWKRLTVTPVVTAQVSPREVEFTDRDGIGPAINFQYKLVDGDWILEERKWDVLFNDRAAERSKNDTSDFLYFKPRIDLNRPDDVGAVGLLGSKLDRSLYRSLNGGTSDGPKSVAQSPPGAQVIKCEGDAFEVITSPERLSALVPTRKGGGEAMLSYSYESLRREAYRGAARVRLPPDVVYYRRIEELLEEHPCPNDYADRPHKKYSDDGFRVPEDFKRVIDALDKKPPSLKGVDTIIRRIDLPLAGVGDHQRAAAVITPDEILNPGGFLLLYVRLEDVRNGTIDLTLSVNGKRVDQMKVPVLAPDQSSFSIENLDDELARFAKK
jgi:hypothetical protein